MRNREEGGLDDEKISDEKVPSGRSAGLGGGIVLTMLRVIP